MSFIASFFLTVLFLSLGELLLLVRVYSKIGFAATLGLCILTGIIGGALVRFQGLQTIKKLNLQLASGHLPTDEILEGIVLIIIGVLLCLPGFITDAFGFVMLIPPVRRQAVLWFKRHFSGKAYIKKSRLNVNDFQSHNFTPPSDFDSGLKGDKGKIIDVDFEERD